MKTFVLMLLVVVCCGQSSFAQKMTARERKAQKASEIEELVESGNFVFDARSANPLTGRRIDLTSTYNLKFDGDTVVAWLPYFGRAYQAPYGDTDGGIKFKEKPKAITREYNERRKLYEIKFEVKTSRDNYRMFLEIGLGGYATLSVNSDHRQMISFYGLIDAPVEDVKD
ncbi:DUF4251 domain-containing protein [Mangrovibacterium sp.]|uniref:DUF4251 domain-containing protein n=1 Tax=Mangrovibacterium sp. TaxID=1961364 RepID=UPI003565FA28